MFPTDPSDGSVVFISYGATYSGASVDGIPNLVEVYNSYMTDDYVQIMINEGETAYTVISFIEWKRVRRATHGYTESIFN